MQLLAPQMERKDHKQQTDHRSDVIHHNKLPCDLDIFHPDELQKDKEWQHQNLIGSQDKLEKTNYAKEESDQTQEWDAYDKEEDPTHSISAGHTAELRVYH
jgi:hypothetical protein